MTRLCDLAFQPPLASTLGVEYIVHTTLYITAFQPSYATVILRLSELLQYVFTIRVLAALSSFQVLRALDGVHALILEEVHLGLQLLVAVLHPLQVIDGLVLLQPRLADLVPQF